MACVLCLRLQESWMPSVESKYSWAWVQLVSGYTTEPLCLKLSIVLFYRLPQSSQYSEDSESGEVLRKRFRSSTREEEEDEDMDVGILKAKKRSKSWNEQDASSSYSHEVFVYIVAFPMFSILIFVYKL